MKIAVVDVHGNEVEQIELDASVFDGKVNDALMHQAVLAFLSNQRKGLAHTKTRGEVSGGGRKPWRQKGTGRARVGSNRSPLWYHGGTTFGPKPHSFYKEFPRRMKALALKSALNAKVRDNEVVILAELTVSSPKTKEFSHIVKNITANIGRVRFVADSISDTVRLAGRNLPKVEFDSAKDLTTYQALNCKKLVLTKKALAQVEERIKKWLK